MDWQIRTFGRHSCRTGDPFEPGDRVVSFVYLDEGPEGGLGRADLLEAEAEAFEAAGRVLGRWTRVLKDEGEDLSAAGGQQVQSAEELLFSLLEAGEGGEPGAESAALAHLLALMLERKRVLKRVGGAAEGGCQRYRHRGQEREIDVPVVDIAPAMLLQLRETFGEIIA